MRLTLEEQKCNESERASQRFEAHTQVEAIEFERIGVWVHSQVLARNTQMRLTADETFAEGFSIGQPNESHDTTEGVLDRVRVCLSRGMQRSGSGRVGQRAKGVARRNFLELPIDEIDAAVPTGDRERQSTDRFRSKPLQLRVNAHATRRVRM